MSITMLPGMFVHALKDVRHDGARTLKTFPAPFGVVEYEELRYALAMHRRETEGQISRRHEVFSLIGEEPASRCCDAIEGIPAEGDSPMHATRGMPVADIGIIASGQAVEHDEIGRYRSLLQESLTGEPVADEILTALRS